jgi:hypothetical protein
MALTDRGWGGGKKGAENNQRLPDWQAKPGGCRLSTELVDNSVERGRCWRLITRHPRQICGIDQEMIIFI